MPGAYAHITLVNIAREAGRLEAIASFPTEGMKALQRHLPFCELGSVSPDYPYLAVTSSKAKAWADLMHYEKTGDRIKEGVAAVHETPKDDQLKAFAWLAGFVAHVTTDVTIHPVVELKVGPYAENQKEHRICEMHQDAYIYQRLNLGPLGVAEHIDSGISKCSAPSNEDDLDLVISKVWLRMLRQCHPDVSAANAPNVNQWHSAFRGTVDKIEEGNRLTPLARHVAVDCGLTYPDEKEVDKKEYINELKTPLGPISYDAIFDKAIDNVVRMWSVLARGIFMGDEAYKTVFGNWNLDTGRDDKNKYVFWEKQA